MADLTQPINKFNIRVYGLLFNRDNELLVSDEIIRDQFFTKFPGGGLEFNESTIECLRREFIEEMNQEIEVGEHFYTTDQFVRSAFRPWEQVICIYYFVKLIGDQKFKTSSKKHDFDSNKEGDQESFRWSTVEDLSPNDFSFLIDSHVVELIKKQHK
ncbi:MAG: NUDIX domain-containing protein [Salibacteraceae bacterium]